MKEDLFSIVEPSRRRLPFLLSVPHCGTGFPLELKPAFNEEMIKAPDDTDWHLDRLYDFAPGLGVTTICPAYSRWVIDLNRDPESKPLYDDGRIITTLCPSTDFNGTAIYRDKREVVDEKDVAHRLKNYFLPYHQEIDHILNDFVKEFGIALFWDGHSIRRHVPTIQPEPFPDFILGDNDSKTAADRFANLALKALSKGNYKVNYNTPFKGGYLTRSKGKPAADIHALQLEMSKDLYMSDNETEYSETRAEPIKKHLKSVFEALIEELEHAV